jgi:DNA-binding NarL/FixJ family response regulator
MSNVLEICQDRMMARTVLIVDDHPSFRASARAILEADGYKVVGEASDGGTALTLAASLRPQLVLLDVQLPDMSGIEVSEALTRAGNGPAVVLVSSREAADYGDLIVRSGALGFVPKDEISGYAIDALL